MENYPLISICVPVYNVEKYLPVCVNSLLCQTYPNIEYVFVDDNSSDESLYILNQLVKGRKLNIQIIHNKENKGLSSVRNIALSNANGEFIIWVDSDDYIEFDTLTKLYKKQKEGNFDIVTYDIVAHYSDKDEIISSPDYESPRQMTLLLLSRKAPVCVCGRLIRKSLYNNGQISCMPGINCGEDFQVSSRLSYFSERVGSLHETLYHYTCTNQSSYTFKFSRERCDQDWQSLLLLEDFFNNKDKVYSEALQLAKLELAVHHIAHSCKYSDKAYFYICHNRISNICYSYYRSVPLHYRLCLIIKKYCIARFYVLCSSFLYKILKNIFKK